MESDVEAFQGISDSLALGSSTVGVARQAAETVTDLLTEIKGKIVSAQGENVDRVKIQADIDALTGQIGSVVSAAQFNGLNLVNGSTTSIDVLASLDRDGATTSASSITVTSQDLSFGTYTANDVFSSSGAATVSANSDTFVMSLDNGGGSDEITIQDGATAWAAGDKISMMIGDKTVSYTVSASDVDSGANTIADLVAVGLKGAIDELGIDGLTVDYDSANAGTLVFTNDGTSDLSVSGQFTNLKRRRAGRPDADRRDHQYDRCADPDRKHVANLGRCGSGFWFGADADRHSGRFCRPADRHAQNRHRLDGRRRYGRSLGPSAGVADPATAGDSGAVDCQPGPAKHPVAVPLTEGWAA